MIDSLRTEEVEIRPQRDISGLLLLHGEAEKEGSSTLTLIDDTMLI